MAKKTAPSRPASATASRVVGKPAPPVPLGTRKAARPAAGRVAPAPPPRPVARAVAPPSTMIKVRAKKQGYLGHERRRVGDVFKVDRSKFNPSWMVAVDGSTPIQRITGKQELRKKHDEILQMKNSDRITTSEHDVEDTGENPLDAD